MTRQIHTARQFHTARQIHTARQLPMVNPQKRLPRRKGFTLVEVLIVIGIIGVIAGLLVPAVMVARNTIIRQSMAFEVETLSNAVEQFKNKYGVYPPDGSSRSAFERAMRKAFPQIASTEFTTLYSVSNASNGLAASVTVMDPAEAVVFCLGGFSDSKSNPFTGPGGPLVLVPGTTTFQYNVDRTNPLFDFKAGQLTVDNSSGTAISTDEGLLFGAPASNDLLPVYSPSGKSAPYVYYNSSTYSFAVSGATFFSFYNPSTIAGVARPYKSDEVNTNVTQAAAPDRYYRYMNEKSFQIIGAGLDDEYGGIAGTPNSGTPAFFRFPSGNSLNIMLGPTQTPGFSGYQELAGAPSAQVDNATNFSDGTLGDSLP